ncbi:hypothetical protein FOVG_07114 [Fusarium oxysporum f. sp. pisi HDV247]|uniref:Uncharacterized protein n=1 Tax=Fusarium oxysporum f. sp. pisi HDV247 TaxID=1080344 RepID=W9PVV4_FUSOX|nr:hypothetical protein FOVG_07114 [Fusarium oxysporum f. sp. pisi HDV247]
MDQSQRSVSEERANFPPIPTRRDDGAEANDPNFCGEQTARTSHRISQRTRTDAYCDGKHKSQELHDYDDGVIGRRLRLAHSEGRPAHERPYYRWQSAACCLTGLWEGVYSPWAVIRRKQELPRNAYELIALELMHFVGIYFYAYKKVPTSTQIRFEACRIILASEASSYPDSSSSSWLRDLIMSEYDTARQAAREPIRSTIENKLPILLPKGCKTLFEACPLEAQLQAYLRAHRSDDPPSDLRLQQDVTRQIQQTENQSTLTAQPIADWLVGLVNFSTTWLESSRFRAQAL